MASMFIQPIPGYEPKTITKKLNGKTETYTVLVKSNPDAPSTHKLKQFEVSIDGHPHPEMAFSGMLAIQQVLTRLKLRVRDIDVLEVNEVKPKVGSSVTPVKVTPEPEHEETMDEFESINA